ncbi:MAG: hypothetical protein AB1458_12105 [Bacteroidota bacterium]
MVKEIAKDSFAKGYDYQQAGRLVDRAAQRLFTRWQETVKQEKSQEEAILKKLKMIADYIKVTMCEGYMTDLLLVYMGCRSADRPLGEALGNMEEVRVHLLRQMQYAGKTAYLLQAPSQYIFDQRPGTKLKYLMRFAIARQTAQLLYNRLCDLRGKPERMELVGFPAMVVNTLLAIVAGAV